jgi:hypothetical protein
LTDLRNVFVFLAAEFHERLKTLFQTFLQASFHAFVPSLVEISTRDDDNASEIFLLSWVNQGFPEEVEEPISQKGCAIWRMRITIPWQATKMGFFVKGG